MLAIDTDIQRRAEYYEDLTIIPCSATFSIYYDIRTYSIVKYRLYLQASRFNLKIMRLRTAMFIVSVINYLCKASWQKLHLI